MSALHDAALLAALCAVIGGAPLLAAVLELARRRWPRRPERRGRT